jgi:hypothetical protein
MSPRRHHQSLTIWAWRIGCVLRSRYCLFAKLKGGFFRPPFALFSPLARRTRQPGVPTAPRADGGGCSMRSCCRTRAAHRRWRRERGRGHVDARQLRLDAVAPRDLSRIKRLVGAREHRIDVGRRRVSGDPDAHGRADVAARHGTCGGLEGDARNADARSGKFDENWQPVQAGSPAYPDAPNKKGAPGAPFRFVAVAPRVSAWRTGMSGGLLRGRISCARPRASLE